MLKPMILALAASAPGGATPPWTPPFACRADALDKAERTRQRVSERRAVRQSSRAVSGGRGRPTPALRPP